MRFSEALRDPTAAPMGWTRLSLAHPEQARPDDSVVGHSDGRMEELTQVNAWVNRTIAPQDDAAGLMGDEWDLWPAGNRGDCDDYACTKRAELMRLGWSAGALLLSVVTISTGEQHCVLVARTSTSDYVLDNLIATLLPWNPRRYLWREAQTPGNPNFWARVVA